MDLAGRVNVPDAVRFLTRGERGPALAVPVPSSGTVLDGEKNFGCQAYVPESDPKITAASSSSSEPASEPNSILYPFELMKSSPVLRL
jgi:hypothetical protein